MNPQELAALLAERILGAAHLRADEVVTAGGTDLDQAIELWTALGFPPAGPDEALFTDADARNLANVVAYHLLGMATPEVTVPMTRVLGQALSRVATAQASAFRDVLVGLLDDDSIEPDDERVEAVTDLLVPGFESFVTYVWRRHLVAAIRRELLDTTHDARTIGFADLVGYTRETRDLDDESLADLLGRLQRVATEQVTGGGAQILKLLGDGVMFSAESPEVAARAALGLVDACDADDVLPEVRVGLAHGHVLQVEGDVYGETVNRAARLAEVAHPSSVLADEETGELLATVDSVGVRRTRPYRLKGLGSLRPFVVRAVGVVTVVVALVATLVVPRTPDVAAVVAVPDEAVILDGLRSGHPRLMLTPDAVTDLRQRIADDPVVGAWYATLHQRAHDLIGVPPVVYAKPDGLRLLEVSREALRRLQLLGLVYLVDGEPEIAARGWVELEAIAGFANWNPVHFLDTAEMTHAAAVGLDWLHDGLSVGQRSTVVDAIVGKGLIPARDAYDGTAPPMLSWWTTVDHNWNQVTNGGIAIGALAVADVQPELSRHVLREALVRLPDALANYAPDGGWVEGVSYWLYATEYTVFALAALESSLGDDFGLTDVPGFDRTGDVPVHMSGPTGERWNWADDGEPRWAPDAPCLFWLASRFDRPDWGAYQLDHALPDPLDVVWYRPPTPTPAVPPAPLDALFTEVAAVTMRGSWSDPAATWAAVKAGRPQANHNQLDVGTFVVEAEGQRWAMDLGKDDYNLPGYFSTAIGGKRWTYYRNRAEGHNTLVIDPGTAAEDQWVKADAPVSRFEHWDAGAFTVLDLSSAYRGHRVSRGLRLEDRTRVLVQDELDLADPADVWWFWHTRAEVSLAPDGRSATLVRGGQTARIHLLSPPGAVFELLDAKPLPTSPDPAGQAKNTGVRKLAVHLTDIDTATIAVLFDPDETTAPPPTPPTALHDWAVPPPSTTTTTTTTTITPSTTAGPTSTSAVPGSTSTTSTSAPTSTTTTAPTTATSAAGARPASVLRPPNATRAPVVVARPTYTG